MTLIKATLALAMIATPATAQQNCGPRTAVADRLTSQYGETRKSIGLDSGGMVETWANESTGTFTITVTTPSGLTCLVSSGQNFERLTEALPPAGKEGRKLQ